MKNQQVVGLLNPMRDEILKKEPGGRRDDTCDHGFVQKLKIRCVKICIYTFVKPVVFQRFME